MYFLIPISCIVPSAVFWLVWGKVKDNMEIVLNYTVATVVIIFFMLHPMVLKEMMSFFK